MEDFGAKVSQLGVDINDKDSALNFNSGFLIPKILFQGAFTQTTTAAAVAFTHNLGYVPFFLLFSKRTFSSDYIKRHSNQWIISQGNMTETTLSVRASTDSPVYHYFIIFDLPILQNYDAPISKSGVANYRLGDNYGLKIAKPGKNINSDDMRDYIIHSSARSFIVNNIRNGNYEIVGSEHGFTVDHGLGYLPFCIPFGRFGSPGSYYWSNSLYIGNVDIDTASYFVISPDELAFLVFKDPLLPLNAETQEITYG